MGPLAGYKIIEIAGIGPGPMCGMMLSDMGAQVVRVDRIKPSGLGFDTPVQFDYLSRGKRSIAVDLKQGEGIEVVLRLVEQADALIESFRPGVAERLGIGPQPCLEGNPALIYGRVTGWGQDGPYARVAGHDLNYIALSGALAGIGPKDSKPVPPLNLVGDFGGGALYLAFGMVCGLLEARASGKGQVIDAAMVDGSASLMTSIYGYRAAGMWSDLRGDNFLDSGAPFYDVYATKDGEYVSIAAIEPKFYAELLRLIGLDQHQLPEQMDRSGWAEMKEQFSAVFRTRTRDEWCVILEGSDVCFAPVLSLEEAPNHAHNAARATFVENNGCIQPAPAPRFSRTRVQIQGPPVEAGAHSSEILQEWGFDTDEIEKLQNLGIIA
jgi:alpha-methylacyl-CoA racemase